MRNGVYTPSVNVATPRDAGCDINTRARCLSGCIAVTLQAVYLQLRCSCTVDLLISLLELVVDITHISVSSKVFVWIYLKAMCPLSCYCTVSGGAKKEKMNTSGREKKEGVPFCS